MASSPSSAARGVPTATAVSAAPTNREFPALDAALVLLTRLLLNQSSFRSAAMALCTDLAMKSGAARVTLGWQPATHSDCKPVALSNSASTELDQELAEQMSQAMAETIDQRCALQFPVPANEPPARHILRAHQLLARATQGTVLSVPLVYQGHTTGVLLLEYPMIDTPGPELRRLIEHSAVIAAPLLSLLFERDRPWYRRLTRPHLARAGRASRVRLWRFVAAVTALLLLAAAIVPIDHKVSAPARIEGEVQRLVASPTKGYLKAVHVRPGDTVRAGQLLAELGERDLELERNKLRSEVAQHDGAAAAALAKGDRAAMAVAQSKGEEARAQLGLIDHQLEQVQLTAPIAGVLIQGDLAQSIGMPIDRGQTLFTVAPADRYRVIVELDERDIRRARIGQSGELALSALPWDTLGLEVKRVAPMAGITEGRNVFEIEAQLLGSAPAEIRPGLRGTAHLDAGQATLLSIWGNRALDLLRRWTWRWSP